MVSNEFMLELVSKTDIFEELRLGHITLDNDEHRNTVKCTLMMQNNDEIDLDILKAYLKTEKECSDMEESFRYQALKLKYDALTTIPSTIEKTMTPAQLWQSGSPFWTEKLTGCQIVDVLYAHSWSDKLRNEFDFEKAYNNANNPLNQRLTRARPYLNIDKELLNEESKCNKCLTPLIC